MRSTSIRPRASTFSTQADKKQSKTEQVPQLRFERVISQTEMPDKQSEPNFGPNLTTGHLHIPDANTFLFPKSGKRSESFNLQPTDRSTDSGQMSQGNVGLQRRSYKMASRGSFSTQANENSAKPLATLIDNDKLQIPLGYCKMTDGLLYTCTNRSVRDDTLMEYQIFSAWNQLMFCKLGGLDHVCGFLFFPSGGFFFGKLDENNIANGPGLLRLPLLKTDIMGVWKQGRITGKAWVGSGSNPQASALFHSNRLQSYLHTERFSEEDLLSDMQEEGNLRFSDFTQSKSNQISGSQGSELLTSKCLSERRTEHPQLRWFAETVESLH